MKTARTFMAIAAVAGLVAALPVSAKTASGNPAARLMLSAQGVPQYNNQDCVRISGDDDNWWWRPDANSNWIKCGAKAGGGSFVGSPYFLGVIAAGAAAALAFAPKSP